MKNLPTFDEFKIYESLLETSNDDLMEELKSLDVAEPYHTVSEGAIMNMIKNKLSKFFLGSLSRISMIDEARKILVDLEIDLIEAKMNASDSIDDIENQIHGLSKDFDKEKIRALEKDKESKIREIETYMKAQRLKIKKAHDYIDKIIDGDARRKEYYEVGRSEDEIALAELEYKLAKDKADSSEIKKYQDKIQKAKEEAEEKAKKLADEMKEKKEKKSKSKSETSVDPEKEKKKISSRRGSDIIKRKRDLEKEIIDIKSEMEEKLNSFLAMMKKPSGVTPRYLIGAKMDLLELSSALDSKTNLLKALSDLGKSESEIASKIKKEEDFTKLADKINRAIIDGKDASTGTKEVINSLFSSTTGDGKGSVSSEKIKDAINKINK